MASKGMHIFFLIGFMGAGKSFWGRQWAQSTGFAFVELDALIEAEVGKSISRIFLEEGEEFFRGKEREMLKNGCSGHPKCIVATGGGTPCFLDNMGWMNDHGTTVYLMAQPELLAQRLMGEKAQRPLLNGLADAALAGFIAKKLAEREPFYKQAHLVLDAADLTEDSLKPYVI